MTQTDPSATVIPTGWWPTSSGSPSSDCLSGSMRWRVPSPLFATHTEPSPVARPAGVPPSGTGRPTTRFCAGSTFTTVRSETFITQRPPSPSARSAGPLPTRMFSTTRLVLGSMRETVLSRKFATHTAPPPVTTPCGPSPTLIGLPTLRFVRGSIRVTVSPSGVRHPHGALADRDAGRLEPVDDGLLDPDGGRVQAHQAAAEAARWSTTDPAPSAMNCGDSPTCTGRPSIFFESGSTLTSVPPSLFRTHTPPSPTATADGCAPTSISSLTFGPSSPVRTTISTTIAATAIAASATGRSGKRLGCGGGHRAARSLAPRLTSDPGAGSMIGSVAGAGTLDHPGEQQPHETSQTERGRDDLPVLLAVDDDPGALERITGELRRRYAADYRIYCELSSEAAETRLREMRDAGDQVALVLADQWLLGASGETGARLLARVRELHPRAKRVLLIDWGAWRFEQTTEAIKEAMALGQIDYYLMKPWRSPDEYFHRTISEFIHEWSRYGTFVRQEVEVVAQWSPRVHELTSLLARNGVPHSFHPCDSPAGRQPAGRARHRGHGQAGRLPARGQAARGPDQRATRRRIRGQHAARPQA